MHSKMLEEPSSSFHLQTKKNILSKILFNTNTSRQKNSIQIEDIRFLNQIIFSILNDYTVSAVSSLPNRGMLIITDL